MIELIESVKQSEKTKSKWRNDHNSKEWRSASRLNKLIFGIPLSQSLGCECLEDLFFYIKRENVKQKIVEKMEKRFILKKGKLLQGMAFGQVGEQSSDEQMIRALKASPGLHVHFKVLPENWREICEIETPEPAQTNEPAKATETKEASESAIDENTSNEEENASVTLGREELEKLKVSQLRSLLEEKKITIPETITRKAELVDFILDKI